MNVTTQTKPQPRGDASHREAGMSLSWRFRADAAARAAAPLWLLVAAALAATMGTWPPHIYL